jgi:hypothetical protein
MRDSICWIAVAIATLGTGSCLAQAVVPTRTLPISEKVVDAANRSVGQLTGRKPARPRTNRWR